MRVFCEEFLMCKTMVEEAMYKRKDIAKMNRLFFTEWLNFISDE